MQPLRLALDAGQLDLEPASRGAVHGPHLIGGAARAGEEQRPRTNAAPVTPLGGTAPASRRTERSGAPAGAARVGLTSAAR